MGLPRPHQRPGVHPLDRAGALQRRLHRQPGLERIPRHPRPDVQSAVRARVPPDPRRRQARGHLPVEARRGGSQRRHPGPHPDRPHGQERQEDRARRRRSGIPDRGQRPDAARLPVHHLREGAAPWRPHAREHPRLPPPRRSPGRRDRLHHQHGRGHAVQHAGDEPPRAGRLEGVRRGLRRQRRAQGQGAGPAGPTRDRPDLHRHRVAGVHPLRPRRHGRQARAHHRRRQHGDGLLPFGQTPGRDGCEGDRAQDAQVLQGVGLGARGRRGRARGHPRESLAGPLHRGGRQADRHGVRHVHLARGERETRAGAGGAHHRPLRHGDSGDRPGERVPLDRARHGAHLRQVGHAGGGQGHAHVDAAGRVLRRRRGVRARQHHLGGGARPSGRDFDPPALPGDPGHRAAAGRPDADQHQDGPARMGLQQRLQPGGAAEDDARRDAPPLLEDDHRGGAGLHRRPDRSTRSSAASTATSRRISPTRCASSATPVSTSARWTA